jgi:hypothetical protein
MIPPRYSLFEFTASIVVAVPKSQTIQDFPYFAIAAKAATNLSEPIEDGGLYLIFRLKSKLWSTKIGFSR